MAKRQLIINYVPGEDCRVAVVNDGKLDEFYSERADSISHVGNIYVGRVTNIEPAISAAFVDFGLESAGFLHVSDLHPRYFPGETRSTKERVGKKTPRRERPAINEALRKGQEIIVQVLKEGVGSKGPTLTSYMSIPGRYLVMMPGMDRVGVSRKVEDETQRAKMKEILDSLDLPEEFGFILRTAGFDRSKAELKRDLAYLLRLEKEMDRRRKAGGKPRLLYSEGDLLIRALRDMMTSETEQVIIDDESAVKRASKFMKIVSPKTVTKLFHYKGQTPIFHALGLEQQIQTVYSREVPLPSGGRLVIDETEALVSIDVNSGKSRSAGDSEDNAYRTNMEAAEEICRQLRLRDLGGIVVNDLIDMRLARHRKDVESRFAEILKADRAKSTVAPIGEFGILEMTRQRMRGSHESLHFINCPTCHGRGLVQKAESVAADALRDLAALLDHASVKRAEMVVNPRVGGELLSSKRRALVRLEKQAGKTVSVRLSDAVAVDRVTFYAYDASGADIEIERLPKFKLSDDSLVQYEQPDAAAIAADEEGWATETAEEAVVESPDAAESDGEGRDAHPIETELAPEDIARVRTKPGARGGRGRRGAAPAAPIGRPPAPITGPRVVRTEDAEVPPGEFADGPSGAGEPVGEGMEGGDGGAHGAGPRLEGDEMGPGGGRRRRRRRGGRGRGGSDAGPLPPMAGAGPGPGHGPGHAPVGPSGPGFGQGGPARPVQPPPLPGQGGQGGGGGQNRGFGQGGRPPVPGPRGGGQGGGRPPVAPPANSLAARFRFESFPPVTGTPAAPDAGATRGDGGGESGAMPQSGPEVNAFDGGDGPMDGPVDGANRGARPEGANPDEGFGPEGDSGPRGDGDGGFDGPPDGTGRRRRRRRRGGRGRGDAGGGDRGFGPGPAGGQAAGGPPQGQQPGKRQDRPMGPPPGGDRQGPPARQPMAPPPLPRSGGGGGGSDPGAKPASGNNPVPAKPRGLYASFRRLKPGEKGNVKRED